MRRAVDVLDPPAAVRPVEDLAALAAEINAEHQAGEAATREGLDCFRRAGEALLKAKAGCGGHGKWLPWLKANVAFGVTTASYYMKLARRWSEISTAENLRDALRRLDDEPDQEDDTPPATPDDEPDVPSFVPGEGTLAEVLGGKASCHVTKADGLGFLLGLPPASSDLVFDSPFYEDARSCGLSPPLTGQDWVNWQVKVFRAALAACHGLVACVCQGRTEGFVWSATPAMLITDLKRAGVAVRTPPDLPPRRHPRQRRPRLAAVGLRVHRLCHQRGPAALE
jgi:hypothetical protein